MSDVIKKAKELSAANKYLYIIDTMAELDDAQLARELGHHNFCLFQTYSYEQEVEVEGDVPGETETVAQSVEVQEMMKCRKLMKDLAYTIRDIRKNGIEVDVLEGIDNPSLLDIYRMSGTCNN